jgi:transcriptional regulator with XRE-family HTH domain
MKKSHKSIYKNARHFAGLTIEEAADRIGISSRTLAAYENGEYVPPADIVAKMCEVYRTDWLAYQHLQTTNPLGKKYLPEIDFSSLPMMVLRFQKEMADASKVAGDMVEVTCDGTVDKQEQEVWNRVTKEIRELVAAGLSVLFAQKEKATEKVAC